MDEGVARRASVDLLAQLAYEHVDRAVAVGRSTSPDPLEELVAGQDAALLARERVQEPELGGGQIGARAVHVCLDVVGVEPKLLDRDGVAATRLRVADPAPGSSSYAGRELLH